MREQTNAFLTRFTSFLAHRACIRVNYEEVGLKRTGMHTCTCTHQVSQNPTSLLIHACSKPFYNVFKCKGKVSHQQQSADTTMDDATLVLDEDSWGPREGRTSLLVCCRPTIRYLSKNRSKFGYTGLGSDIFGYIMARVGLGQRLKAYLSYIYVQ